MTWTPIDLNGDGYTDSYGWDGDRDGNYEQLWVNSDHDSAYEVVLYDTNDDSRWDWALLDVDNNGSFDAWAADSDRDGRLGDYLFFDIDHDGRFETHAYDAAEDGYAEWLRLDTNRDGHADSWYSSAALSSSSTQTSQQRVEAINTQHIVTMNQLRIYGDRLYG